MRAARAGCVLLLLVASACKPTTHGSSIDTPPTAVVAAPVPPASSPSSASAVPSAPLASAPRRIFPLPPTPPGANAEEVAIASSICAAAYVATKGGTSVGCRSHPPFVDEAQMPDGKLPAHTGDPYKFCEIEKVYRGSFTKPGVKQALLSFGSCYEKGDQFATNEANASSALLVEEVDGHWTSKAYEEGLHASACQKSHRADGRDVLLCHASMAAFRVGEINYVYLLDFARPDKHARTIASMFGDVFDCSPFEHEEPSFPSGLVSLRVTNVTLADRNADGTPDLLVDVERARAAPGAPLDKKVKASCKGNPRTAIGAFLPPATKTRIELVSRGDIFEPSPASKRELDRWGSEAPEAMNGLGGAAPESLTK